MRWRSRSAIERVRFRYFGEIANTPEGRSPTSAAIVTALIKSTPRIAWNAATTGAIVQSGTISTRAASSRGDLMGDRPEERRHFPGDGGGDDSSPFAPCDELAVATAEAQLRLPGDVAHRFRQIACAVEQRSAHRTFDENPPGPAVAGLGDPAAPHRVAGGAFRRHQPQVAHHLPRVVEPAV